MDGLLWFLQEVWPLVHQQHPKLVLDVIGKNPDDRIVQLAAAEPQVRLHGFVEDLNDWYDTARVFIAPLRFGSGIKVKVLNAMYRGIPTVTTAIGTEGLEARNGEHLFLSPDPATHADYITTLLTDPDRWTAMRDNSRRLAAGHYTWSRLFAAMDQHLSALFPPER
ncbi:MAG: glycosyltransferase family 4 protein [Bacteroidota bacterium]